MDLNLEYAAHQHATMDADAAANEDDRLAKLEVASGIATRITDFQHRLGAAAACAWSKARFAVPANRAKVSQ
ncbi:hypothetical protein [Qipengyuania mesophila]|uniref:hypothetical protein n=1 Tax=Qipengyuania mesophila TaxID=2867246 RepID=UPI0035111B1C